MKRIVLIKTTNNPTLGHVYEHLYCQALFVYLSGLGLFYFVDYTLQGTTYENGLIDIGIDLYSPSAEALDDKLTRLPMAIDEKALEIALAQVVAEERHNVWGVKATRLLTLLQHMHDRPWLTLDAVRVIHLPRRQIVGRDLYLTEPRVRAQTLHLDLVADVEWLQAHPDLIPLFDIVSHVILENIARELTAEFGYYREDNPSMHTRSSARSSQKLVAWIKYRKQLTNEMRTARAAMQRLLQRGLVEKISDYLGGLRREQPHVAPDELAMFETTRALVGYRGWREIGTEANICDVLEHTTLELRYGRERQQIPLADVLSFTINPA